MNFRELMDIVEEAELEEDIIEEDEASRDDALEEAEQVSEDEMAALSDEVEDEEESIEEKVDEAEAVDESEEALEEEAVEETAYDQMRGMMNMFDETYNDEDVDVESEEAGPEELEEKPKKTYESHISLTDYIAQEYGVDHDLAMYVADAIESGEFNPQAKDALRTMFPDGAVDQPDALEDMLMQVDQEYRAAVGQVG